MNIRRQNFFIVSDVYQSFFCLLVNILNPFWNPHSAYALNMLFPIYSVLLCNFVCEMCSCSIIS
jgi:hypothetical protein